MRTLEIRHTTTYRYGKPVAFGEHRMMLRPKESYDQRIISSRLIIDPEPVEIRYVHDVFGNCVGIARFETPEDHLRFESRIVLEHSPAPLVTAAGEAFAPSGPSFPFAYGAEDIPDLLRSIERHHPDEGGLISAWARRFLQWNGPTPVLGLLAEMTRAIHQEFSYARRLEAGTQTPSQTLASKSGTCRDFAVLMIEAARSLGLAARFVSGYIYSPASGQAPARIGGGHTHAWVQIYLPSCGWVEFDPTNGIIGNTDLVRVAVVRDPRQAVPLSGSWSGAQEDYLGMEVEVAVRDRRGAAVRAA
jgi:transglutaminase-like putative cysteine protease